VGDGQTNVGPDLVDLAVKSQPRKMCATPFEESVVANPQLTVRFSTGLYSVCRRGKNLTKSERNHFQMHRQRLLGTVWDTTVVLVVVFIT